MPSTRRIVPVSKPDHTMVLSGFPLALIHTYGILYLHVSEHVHQRKKEEYLVQQKPPNPHQPSVRPYRLYLPYHSTVASDRQQGQRD